MDHLDSDIYAVNENIRNIWQDVILNWIRLANDRMTII